MKKTNVLITGICGFIGSNLEEYISKRHPSWHIYGVDKRRKKAKNYFKIDIRNEKSISKVLCKIRPKYIFHLAGSVRSDNCEELLLSNVLNTFILLSTIKGIDSCNPRIIIPSSASEYGKVKNSKMPIKENYDLNPVSLYGFTKMIQTKLSLLFHQQGLDVVVARIFNIIGKNTPVNLSLGRFACELALMNKNKKRSIIYTKMLRAKRDFLDVRDVCKCLVSIAVHGKKGEIYNICSGKSYEIRDLLKKLICISDMKNIKIVELKECNKEFDILNSVGSIKKLKKIVKTSNMVPINKSLRDTYHYYLAKA